MHKFPQKQHSLMLLLALGFSLLFFFFLHSSEMGNIWVTFLMFFSFSVKRTTLWKYYQFGCVSPRQSHVIWVTVQIEISWRKNSFETSWKWKSHHYMLSNLFRKKKNVCQDDKTDVHLFTLFGFLLLVFAEK